MALRLVDVYLPEGTSLSTKDLVGVGLIDSWDFPAAEAGHLVRVLVKTEYTEKFIEAIQEQLGAPEAYRIVMLPVETSLPRPNDDEPRGETSHEEPAPRISREELYDDVNESLRSTPVYYTLVLLSTIVAAGGMLRDDVAVVVGAMVIAPLIGPNLALALATTLADTALLFRSLRVNLVGLLLALALAIGIGMVFDVALTNQIAARTQVDLGALALALAAGVAGALSVTRGISTALIGVMVAVALLPPLVAAGMLLGSGHWLLAYRSGLLLLINVTSVNLASVLTFVVQGVRPSAWYEEEEAKKRTRYAIAGWVVVMGVLVVAVLLAPENLLPE